MYELPDRRAYSFGIHDFGAGGDALEILGPAGKKGRLVDIMVSATETFNAVTTQGFVRVGSAADADEFGELSLGTTEADTAVLASAQPGGLKTDSNGQSVLIDADEDVQVAFVAPTGGTPAGMGYVQIWIDWF